MSAKKALLAVSKRSMSNVSISSICTITCRYNTTQTHDITTQPKLNKIHITINTVSN